MKSKFPSPLIAGLIFTVIVAAAYAQFEVANSNYSGGSIRYGNTYTSQMLPSEAAYATWMSGDLPSQILIHAQQVGPLAGGTGAYIPPAYTPESGYNPTPGYAMGSVNYAPQPYSYAPINPILSGQ